MKRQCLLAFASLPLVVAPVMAAPGTVDVTLAQRAKVSVSATTSGCENNPGPYITLTGELKLTGVGARVILTNNAKFTHVAAGDVFADVTLLEPGETRRFAKQPPQGGVGGNPWIYLMFTDGSGKPVSTPQLLGRCVQGLNTASLDFPFPTKAHASLTSGFCSNNPGPYITLDGELKLGGLGATLIFTNNAKFTHVHAEDVTFNVVLIPEGESVVFHKQPPLGGAGGNPWIYLQFTSGSGESLTNPILLGRCVQLSK